MASSKIIAMVVASLFIAVLGGLGASALSSMISEQNVINPNSDITDESAPDSFTDSIAKLFFSSET